MLSSLLGSAARSAARAAVARAKARNEALVRAGYHCPSCGTDAVPVYLASTEKLTVKMWLRGGLVAWFFRKYFSKSTLGCPRCRHQPDLSRWLGGVAADWK